YWKSSAPAAEFEIPSLTSSVWKSSLSAGSPSSTRNETNTRSSLAAVLFRTPADRTTATRPELGARKRTAHSGSPVSAGVYEVSVMLSCDDGVSVWQARGKSRALTRVPAERSFVMVPPHSPRYGDWYRDTCAFALWAAAAAL